MLVPVFSLKFESNRGLRYHVKRKETVLFSNVDFEMVNIIFKAKT